MATVVLGKYEVNARQFITPIPEPRDANTTPIRMFFYGIESKFANPVIRVASGRQHFWGMFFGGFFIGNATFADFELVFESFFLHILTTGNLMYSTIWIHTTSES